tara:strand:+ start:491 stop:1339 length:849 start_codon:yes stop_codon:yes gene_type:complete
MSADKTKHHKHLTDEELIGLQSKDKTDVSRQELWSRLEDCDTCFTKFTLYGASLDNVRKDKEHFKDITVKPPPPPPPGVESGKSHTSTKPSAPLSVETVAVPWTLLGLNQQKWMVTAAFAASVFLFLLLQPPSYVFTHIDDMRSVNVEGSWRGSNESWTSTVEVPQLTYNDGDIEIKWTQNNANSNLFTLDINGDIFETRKPYLLIKNIEFPEDTLYLSVFEFITKPLEPNNNLRTPTPNLALEEKKPPYPRTDSYSNAMTNPLFEKIPVIKVEVTYLIKKK